LFFKSHLPVFILKWNMKVFISTTARPMLSVKKARQM
jgi:hypothetical protein